MYISHLLSFYLLFVLSLSLSHTHTHTHTHTHKHSLTFLPSFFPCLLSIIHSFTNLLFFLYHVRKQAERAARGRKETKRETYFDCLVVDFLRKEGEKDKELAPFLPSYTGDEKSCFDLTLSVPERQSFSLDKNTKLLKNNLDERTHSTYPWDDTPLLESDPPTEYQITPHTSIQTGIKDLNNLSTENQKNQYLSDEIKSNSRISSGSNKVINLKGNNREISSLDSTECSFRAPMVRNIAPPPPFAVVVPVPVPVPTPILMNVNDSVLNMFWLKKSELPCICTDRRNGQVNNNNFN